MRVRICKVTKCVCTLFNDMQIKIMILEIFTKQNIIYQLKRANYTIHTKSYEGGAI